MSSSLLGPLTNLGLMRQGPLAYFSSLLDSSDDVLRCAGWCAVLDGGAMTSARHDALLANCNFASVRRRAFDYFESIFEHDLSRRCAETLAPSFEDALMSSMAARLADDPMGRLRADVALYLAAGTATYLVSAVDEAETMSGWQTGVEWAVRAATAQPLNINLAHKLITLLEASRQVALLRDVAAIYASTGVLRHVADLCLAIIDNLEGDGEACLARLRALDKDPALKGALNQFRANILKLRAEALDKVGDYVEAFAADLAVNRYDAERNEIDKAEFFQSAEVRASLPIPTLPADPRTDCYQMVGFPRSGTTLLENVLAAHPLIETFEEIPSFQSIITRISQVGLSRPDGKFAAETYLAGRAGFYGEIDRRRKKPEASVLIDKLPIRSSDAVFLNKLFPERRFIFSIRHPFDVALSCFRQRFNPNPAMENFHSLEDIARIYDFTMTQWFSVHGMDDPKVRYVRYDALVENFVETTAGVLEFLGVPWSDEVHQFAEHSAKRSAKTPSYQKVRQGLAIGLQSSWQNYRFAFQPEAVRPLHKWAEFFGYRTG